MKNTLMICCLVVVSACSVSCARQISSDVYSGSSVGEAAESYFGVIVGSRQVTVEGSESLGDNTAGLIGGGIAGGLLGSMVGGGKGNTLATVAGAGLGAVGGAYAEKALKSQQAMEYTVSLDNGQMRTIVQGLEPRLASGQNVTLMIYHSGRSRIVPRQ